MRWMLLSKSHVWHGNYKRVYIETDSPVHLYLHGTTKPPDRRKFWAPRRGDWWLCIPHTYLPTNFIIEQDESGDTLGHTFWIGPWRDLQNLWYYFDGTRWGLKTLSKSPVFWQFYAQASPSLIYPAIMIPCPDAIIRPGNRYAAWAYGAYYVLICTPGDLTMWRVTPDEVVHCDPGNDPVPSYGVYSDACLYIRPNSTTIHIAARTKRSPPDPDMIEYRTFDPYTETWQRWEPFGTAFREGAATADCSIAVDASGIPHVCYTVARFSYQAIAHQARTSFPWPPPDYPLATLFRNYLAPSSWCGPYYDRLHLIAPNNVGEVYYNSKWNPGPWEGRHLVASSALNLPVHSVCGRPSGAQVADIANTFELEHRMGPPPFTPDLSLPRYGARQASMLCYQSDTNNQAIAYLDSFSRPSIVRSKSGSEWFEPQLASEHFATHISANTHNDEVLSILYKRSAPAYPYFCSFLY